MITHDFKLFFVHIPKCAGRSVCDMFNQRFDHYTAAYLQREYETFWNDYKKFTIVRNPYDRLVSLYHYIRDHRRHANERIAVDNPMPTFRQWLKINIENYMGDFSFSSAEGYRGSDGNLGSSFWFSSQFRRISDANGKIIVDHIFKLDNGTQEIEDFLQSITHISAKMPHSNKSEYPDFLEFYDDKTIALASSFIPIQEDCLKLGYQLL